MKIIYGLLLLVCASVTTSSQSADSKQTDQTGPQFTLTISLYQTNSDEENTAEQVLKFGSSVSLRIRKTNISNHEIIKYPETGGPFGDHFDIRDSTGNLVEWKKLDNSRIGGEARITGTNDMVLQPGESKVDYAPLSSWFNLSQPGTYTIQVSSHISNDLASDVVKSNIITVTILPADSKPPEPGAGAPK
jgi:hypothetical protein